MRNTNPLFWYSCFVRLFPRGDCAEKDPRRQTFLSSDKWANTLIQRDDFREWRYDVEFIASMYNVFLRRDQIAAVEMSLSQNPLSEADVRAMQETTAKGLVETALASGDVNSVKQLLKKRT